MLTAYGGDVDIEKVTKSQERQQELVCEVLLHKLVSEL